MPQKPHRGCLVVHGLTGTPANMVTIIEALESRGYLVKAPLLAGHGKDVSALGKSRWQDWYDTVLKAYAELAQQVQEIYFVGVSMGSLLGMKLAEDQRPGTRDNRHDKLKALALLGVPFHLRPIFRCLVIPWVRYTPLRLFIRSTAKNYEKSVLDPHGRDFYRENSLPRMPAPAVFQTQNLKKIVARDLSKIHRPLLLIHGLKDHLSDPTGMEEIRSRVSSQKVETLVMPNSAHVLTLDFERKEVAQKIIRFFDGLSSAQQTASAATGISGK